MMKKIIAVMSIAVICLGATLPTLAATQSKVGCSQFSIEKLDLKNIKKGKLLCGMKITAVKKVITDKTPLSIDNISVGLSGGITLSGQFHSEGDSFTGMGAGNYFIPDQSTLKKYAFLSDNIVIANSNVNTLLRCKRICDEAVKITIDTYTINHAGTEVSDEAHLGRVLSVKSNKKKEIVQPKNDLITIDASYKYENEISEISGEKRDEVCFSNMNSAGKNLDGKFLCFNSDDVKKLFLPKGSSGSAKIIVENYSSNDAAPELGDSAKFIQLLKVKKQ